MAVSNPSNNWNDEKNSDVCLKMCFKEKRRRRKKGKNKSHVRRFWRVSSGCGSRCSKCYKFCCFSFCLFSAGWQDTELDTITTGIFVLSPRDVRTDPLPSINRVHGLTFDPACLLTARSGNLKKHRKAFSRHFGRTGLRLPASLEPDKAKEK